MRWGSCECALPDCALWQVGLWMQWLGRPGALPALRQWQADHNPAAPITLESVARCLAHLAASTASYIATHDIPAEVPTNCVHRPV